MRVRHAVSASCCDAALGESSKSRGGSNAHHLLAGGRGVVAVLPFFIHTLTACLFTHHAYLHFRNRQYHMHFLSIS
jgi:hypothetical protein